MSDPYSILGVSKNATDEAIKSAYKELIKKYHPDNYNNNPLSDLALEKTQEINEAYDKIMKIRQENRNNGGYQNTNNYESSSQFQDIRIMINQGRIIESEEILDGVPENQKTAEWYFLKGTVFYQKGWLDEAIKFFNTACQKDSSNSEYRYTLNRMMNQQKGYFNSNPYGGYDNRGSSNACSCCQQLICLDCCCECMGGDLISCC